MPSSMSGRPASARSWRELVERVNELGFLPLFRNEVRGFSAEELTWGQPWWSGDPEEDPWYWREAIARSGAVAYGKFFAWKAGFLSLDWLPVFANWRRGGYDFDARWEDGLASHRAKKLMDCFQLEPEWTGARLREAAGFGRGGEKNFEGTVTQLQMQTYLIIRDFRQKVGRNGRPYGLPVSVYATPETVWGYERVTAAYPEEPEVSARQILDRIRSFCPDASPVQMERTLGRLPGQKN